MVNSRSAPLLLTLAVCVPWLSSLVNAVAEQPQRAEIWIERPAGETALMVRAPLADPTRAVVLRLQGDALRPRQLPFDVSLPPSGARQTPAGNAVGDAKVCSSDSGKLVCRGVQANVTIYAIGVAEGAQVQGLVTAVDGVPVATSERGVFVGWVHAAGKPAALP